MMQMLEAIVRLRRDSVRNYEPISTTWIPENGEVVLIDTQQGLRAKVGDNIHTLAELDYFDHDSVLQGYYSDNIFYVDDTKTEVLPATQNKLYIDTLHSKIYYYDGTVYVPITEHLPSASSIVAGVMKLYSTTGQNTDGTMTQKAITDQFKETFKASVDSNNETIILFQ